MAVGQDLIAALAMSGRVCVGLVFLVAGLKNASHWRIVPGVIANYRLLPAWAVGPVSLLLPPTELILALLLLSAALEPWPALAGMALLGIFAAAMTVNISRDRTHIDCGCGESFLRQTLNFGLVIRNAGLAVLLIPSLARPAAEPISLALSGIAAGLGLFLLYLLLNLVASLPSADTAGHRLA
jgi:hypothetical protein